MRLIRSNRVVDLLEYTASPGGPALPTDEGFDPYLNWWTRRRADALCFAEPLRGTVRDYLFGDRPGEFWRVFFDRGLFTALGRPDSDLARRWLLREEATAMAWLVDFTPRVYEAPLAHVEAYCQRLTPVPVNTD